MISTVRKGSVLGGLHIVFKIAEYGTVKVFERNSPLTLVYSATEYSALGFAAITLRS